jgi:hypothetical protein
LSLTKSGGLMLPWRFLRFEMAGLANLRFEAKESEAAGKGFLRFEMDRGEEKARAKRILRFEMAGGRRAARVIG